MYINLKISGEELELLCDKAVFWPAKRCLIIADVHLGKSAHFRKNGFSVPAKVATKTLDRLASCIENTQAAKVIFLGDLFHSAENAEWNLLAGLIDTFFAVEFVLVEGNHDILNAKHYTDAGIKVLDKIVEHPFSFTHHPEPETGHYNICGHIHPAVEMVGKGRQSLRLPCFFFGEHFGVLPAFGEFTGTFLLKPEKNDKVFICAPGKVLVPGV